MALVSCAECDREVSDQAKACPHCGYPLRATSKSTETKVVVETTQKPWYSRDLSAGGCFTVLILFVVIIIVLTDMPSTSTSSRPLASPVQPTQPRRITRYAHRVVNVREGRGADRPVVAQIRRGERVEVDSLHDGWYRVFRNGRRLGYTASSVLESSPLPRFEIVDWNWRSDADFAGDGAVIWTVEVRNNTTNYVSSVIVEFTTYDDRGQLMDTDFTYITGLQPGGTATGKGYATYFGTEKTGRIQIKR